MSGSECLLWSYGQFKKMTFFPPDPLALTGAHVPLHPSVTADMLHLHLSSVVDILSLLSIELSASFSLLVSVSKSVSVFVFVSVLLPIACIRRFSRGRVTR